MIGLASIFTMVYAIRAFQRVWWVQPLGDAPAGGRGDRLVAPLLLIALALALGLWAEPLVGMAQSASVWMADPAAYILAVLGAGG